MYVEYNFCIRDTKSEASNDDAADGCEKCFCEAKMKFLKYKEDHWQIW